MTNRIWRAGLLAIFAFLLLVPLAAAKDDERKVDWDVYRRDVKGIGKAVDLLALEARLRDAKHVLIAFDQITFRPPPGQNEYSDTHDYRGDVPKWLEAIGAWQERTSLDLHIVGTLGPGPIRVGQPAWKHSIQRALDHAWFDDDSFSGFEPALAWIKRWTPKSDGMLVLVASEYGPERWAERSPVGFGSSDDRWRRRLRPCGQYWDEEAIAKALGRRDCPLLVIAPEVCFGDELPLPTLPALPWASRPIRPATPLIDPGDLFPPTGPTPGGGSGSKEEWRKRLDELLKPLVPDPEERKRVIEEMLAGGGQKPTVPGESPITPGDDEPFPLTGGRFDSTTPLWFPHYGGTVLVNDHTPAAFGYWPFARVAAATGGRYFPYPFPPSDWLDVCPRDDAQLKRLAPELVKRSRFTKLRASDPALSALQKAEAIVLADTPWSDDWGAPRARGWDAFETVRPLKDTRGFRRRRKPYDLYLMGTSRQLQREGQRLGKLVVQYDAALKVLDRALVQIDEGRDTRSSSRAIANLRLGRFWFSMSAFHLDALGIYLREVERFAPPGFDRKRGSLHVTYVPAIRMSDCLDAYDGRTLAPEDEARYERSIFRSYRDLGSSVWEEGQVVPGQQGNILEIPRGHPDYRAKRDRSAVLRHIDRRLMGRALDMIQAGRQVMAHHAKTPWGWTTYYADAYTFIFLPATPTPGMTNRHGPDGEEDEPPPWTPTPRGGGGSTPGGPTTPR